MCEVPGFLLKLDYYVEFAKGFFPSEPFFDAFFKGSVFKSATKGSYYLHPFDFVVEMVRFSIMFSEVACVDPVGRPALLLDRLNYSMLVMFILN